VKGTVWKCADSACRCAREYRYAGAAAGGERKQNRPRPPERNRGLDYCLALLTLPDGLLEVVFVRDPRPVAFVVEIATYPERRVVQQLRDVFTFRVRVVLSGTYFASAKRKQVF